MINSTLTVNGYQVDIPAVRNLLAGGNSGCPQFLQSSGTMGANGALSGIGSLQSTFGSCYLYFPTGAVYAGSLAGWYYTVMSGTTAGTVYNNRYITGDPTVPPILVPVVDAGPGAYVQTTATDITVRSIVIPGGYLGRTGSCRITMFWGCQNTANVKTAKVNLGATQIHGVALTATYGSTHVRQFWSNGSVSQQTTPPVTQAGTGNFTSANVVTTAVNTAADATLSIIANMASAAEYIALLGATIELIRGDA